VVTGRVTSGRDRCWSAGCRGGLDDLLRVRDVELGGQVALGLGELGGLPERPGRAGKRAQGEQVQLVGDLGPRDAGSGLRDADQQQGQPAQDDVGADAFFLAMVDRAQVDDLLEVAPAALDFQQLLIPQRDVLGRELGVRAAEQLLAVQVLLGLDGGGVGPEQAPGGDAQVPVQARPGGDDPAQPGPLGGGQLVAAGDHLLQLGEHPGPNRRVALGGLGVEADDEPLGVGDAHFLDPQVLRDVLVAALPGQGGVRLGGPGAQLLADDVMAVPGPQVPAVLGGGEAPVGDPDDPGQGPVRMSSLTWRISAESFMFPGQHHTRTAMPSRVTAMPMTTWGRSSRWSLNLP